MEKYLVEEENPYKVLFERYFNSSNIEFLCYDVRSEDCLEDI